MLKKYKNAIFYIVSIVAALLFMYAVIEHGQANLESQRILEHTVIDHGNKNIFKHFLSAFHSNLTNPLSIFILQILVIIITARFFAYFSNKIGQPAVVGEIIAGIVLGPSVIGLFYPEFSAFLFPVESLGNLKFLSQVGLILFMFVVGMELDLKVLRTKAHEAVIVSHVSIIVPFMLGTGLAYFVYLNYSPPHVTFLPFALFMGIAMSITAFPVLARILQERELTGTAVGSLVITCAAADDISAWCIFAAVVAIAKATSILNALYVIVLALGYVFVMIKVIRPFLARFSHLCSTKDGLNKSSVALFFIILILSAYLTEIIGIHAIFGAFMAGVIMPTDMHFRKMFAEKIEDVSLLLFLPLFFVFTGLRTQITLISGNEHWQICGWIILVAVTGKFIGSMVASKFVGQNWRNSLIIGALMNTRGLMELIILNIGFDLGILTPEIFAMMVIMALATTFMAGPFLDLVDWLLPDKSIKAEVINTSVGTIPKNKVMIAFADPDKAKGMLALSKFIWGAESTYTAINVMESEEVNQYDFEGDKKEKFVPLQQEAQNLGLRLNTILKVTHNVVSKEVAKQAHLGGYDFLMIGIGSSIYKDTLLGKFLNTTINIINPEKLFENFTKRDELIDNEIVGERTKYLIAEAYCNTGIFFNKNFQTANRILVLTFSISDSFLFSYINQIAHNSKDSKITIVDGADLLSNSLEFAKEMSVLNKLGSINTIVKAEKNLDEKFLHDYDLMLISYDSWRKHAADTKNLWLAYAPSTLIIKPARQRSVK